MVVFIAIAATFLFACLLYLALSIKLAPVGFECERCGFLLGSHEDEREHLLAHDIADGQEQTLEEVVTAILAQCGDEAA